MYPFTTLICIRRTSNFGSDLTKNWPKKRSILVYGEPHAANAPPGMVGRCLTSTRVSPGKVSCKCLGRALFRQIWTKSGRSYLQGEWLRMSHIQRIALCVRYDGARYHGWQHQEGLMTVQGCLERAVSYVANHSVAIVCAGRTDAGVHATGQIVHFDTEANRHDHAWVFGTNSNLPPDISVGWAKHVWQDFHARHSALSRRYRYVIYNHEIRPGILRQAVGWCYRLLDEKRMHEAGQYLLGEHDFSAFRGTGCESPTAIREIYDLAVVRYHRMVIVDVRANAFLLHMVRNIVGALVAVGSGEKPIEWVREVLESRDRRCGSITIQPNGLYLVKVEYPDECDLPAVPLGPFFLPFA
jgi:tRNA pseudouridine38-40 synthase